MKLAAKIATGLAILGLAAPVLAETQAPAPAAKVQTHRRHVRSVAQAEQKKGEEKKVEKKGHAKAKKGAEKAKTEAPAKTETPAPTPAPAK